MGGTEPGAEEPIYRVNNFAVPAAGRDDFLAVIARTHATMRREEGFVRDLILEKQSGSGVFNIVTFIEFAGPDAVKRAVTAVAELDRQIGLDRQEMTSRLGIRSDMANYRAPRI